MQAATTPQQRRAAPHTAIRPDHVPAEGGAQPCGRPGFTQFDQKWPAVGFSGSMRGTGLELGVDITAGPMKGVGCDRGQQECV